MNVVRAAMLAAGVTVNVAWLVSICVRGSVGAPDLNPKLSMGPLPAAPAPLTPLNIPQHDPFMADVLKGSTSLVSAAAYAPAGRSDVAAFNVPDVASFAAAGKDFGVVATIVGRDESYALVEDGMSVHVVHVGDAFAASMIAEIAIDHVRLANGTQIAMVRRSLSPALQPLVASGAAPSSAPSISPGPASSAARAPADRSNYTQLHSSSSVQLPNGTVPQAHPLIGQPTVVQPNGNPALNMGGSVFPTTLPTPSIVPLGGTMPGGRP